MTTHYCYCCALPLDGGQCPMCDGGPEVACVPPHECVIRGSVIADPAGCAESIDWAPVDA